MAFLPILLSLSRKKTGSGADHYLRERERERESAQARGAAGKRRGRSRLPSEQGAHVGLDPRTPGS